MRRVLFRGAALTLLGLLAGCATIERHPVASAIVGVVVVGGAVALATSSGGGYGGSQTANGYSVPGGSMGSPMPMTMRSLR